MEWHSLTNLNHSSAEISADVHVTPDSPWFSGHFPGEPILPGIAQIAMVFDAIAQCSGNNLKISNIKKIRFKQIIRPDDNLKIVAVPAKGNDLSYSFRIMVNGEIACTGSMSVDSSG